MVQSSLTEKILTWNLSAATSVYWISVFCHNQILYINKPNYHMFCTNLIYQYVIWIKGYQILTLFLNKLDKLGIYQAGYECILFVNCSYKHVNKTFSIYENPVNSEKRSYSTCVSECLTKED